MPVDILPMTTQVIALVPGTNNDISGIGALSCSRLTVNGSTVSSAPSYVVSIRPGTAAINKALVLGASGEIGTIISLTATQITGTLQTAAQTNITSLGTLSGLTIAGNLVFTGASRTITGLSSISATTLTGALSTATQTGITSLGTLTGLTIGGVGLSCPNIKFWKSTTALYDNFDHLAFIGFSYGGAVGQKALVVDVNKDIGSIRTLDAQNLNGSIKVSGTLGDFGSIRISGTDVITSSRHIQNIGNISCSGTMNAFAGYQVNSVAFVDASRNISTATLSTSGDITCSGSLKVFLPYGNQANITTVGSLTELGINLTPANEYFSITGSGTDYLDSSYTRMLTFKGSNISPVQFQIEVNNGTNATSTNATWIGNYTSDDLRFGTNQTTCMTLTNTGRLGLSTVTPSAPLHVSNTVIYTWNSAGNVGLTVYRLRTDSGVTETATGTPTTYTNVCGIFNGYIGCEAMVMQSDRRLKQDIVDVPISRVECLYKTLKVKLYIWKQHPDKPKELGLIAQDVLDQGFLD
ncbi:unnamed protein product [Phytophthora lilii]|uniref:Unnamed protein product n=1 Tax=Phytophthora lilii TaxID=2077276 RepID=A0A9W6WLR7_9STRA|nr:unnamed protein product [Phytophthora lilii]